MPVQSPQIGTYNALGSRVELSPLAGGDWTAFEGIRDLDIAPQEARTERLPGVYGSKRARPPDSPFGVMGFDAPVLTRSAAGTLAAEAYRTRQVLRARITLKGHGVVEQYGVRGGVGNSRVDANKVGAWSVAGDGLDNPRIQFDLVPLVLASDRSMSVYPPLLQGGVRAPRVGGFIEALGWSHNSTLRSRPSYRVDAEISYLRGGPNPLPLGQGLWQETTHIREVQPIEYEYRLADGTSHTLNARRFAVDDGLVNRSSAAPAVYNPSGQSTYDTATAEFITRPRGGSGGFQGGIPPDFNAGAAAVYFDNWVQWAAIYWLRVSQPDLQAELMVRPVEAGALTIGGNRLADTRYQFEIMAALPDWTELPVA